MGKGIGELTSKAIMGMYFMALSVDNGEPWLGMVANNPPFASTQDSEKYGWLGQVPGLQRWAAGRQRKGLKDYSHTIINEEWESTLDILIKDMRQDKTGQLQIRVNDHTVRAQSHDADLITTLLVDGTSETCYDGEYFFDTDHPVGESTDSPGTASNKLTSAIVDKDAATVAEMSTTIYAAITAMAGFKDDQNEPMNTAAKNFVVMVPQEMFPSAQAAIADMTIQGTSGAIDNALARQKKYNVTVEINPRLTATDAFYIFRTDASVKPIIRQQEQPLTASALAEGSDYAFNFKSYQFGLEINKGVGYGFWQYAIKHTFTTAA